MTKQYKRYLALRSLTAAVGNYRKAIGEGREHRNAIYMKMVRAHRKAAAALGVTEGVSDEK